MAEVILKPLCPFKLREHLDCLIELQDPKIMKDDSHMGADHIICEILKELGLEDIVKEWEKVGKWYA